LVLLLRVATSHHHKATMMKYILAALALSPTLGFVPSSLIHAPSSKLALSMTNEVETSTSTPSRRRFIDNVTTGAAAIASSVLLAPSPAMAYGLGKANDKLSSYGLSALQNVPNGYSALAEIYGKAGSRSPLLVAFGFPFDWVVTLPSQDVNGEDGTIQAGEYAKGDTATFFVVPSAGKTDIQSKDKDFFKNAIIAAISQKGANIYQDFKVTKLEPGADGKYMFVDFKYTLITGAGFEVERNGVASVTSTGDGVQLLWAASIAARFRKKTEVQLRSIVRSFVCYSDGLNFSADLRPAPADDF